MARDPLLLVLAVLCGLAFNSASAKTVNFTDCGSKEAKILSMDITPCDEYPCKEKIGTTVTGTLTFTAEEYITSARVKAYAVIDGLNIPLPIPSDACSGYGLVCPINKTQKASFVIKQEIEQGFPQQKLGVKGEMIDPQGNMIFCFQVPIVITSQDNKEDWPANV